MAATATETLEQEYDRLLDERAAIQSAARKVGATSDKAREQMAAAMGRLREILAIPPDGYTLPRPAANLVSHAQAHGWLTLIQWTPPGWDREPFVTVHVGRKVMAGELDDARGDRWSYKLTWHSRDCQSGKLRLFGSGLASTPDRPASHDAPSVKAITAVIAQHPGPDAAPLALF